jgi:hypothetical protein
MRKRLGERGLLSDDRRPTAIFDEVGRVYRACNSNGRRILRYHVDGQMITEGQRCDYLMGLPELDEVYLIELKGAELEKAVRQVHDTFLNLRATLNRYHVAGRIVLSRLRRPALKRGELVALEKRLAGFGVRVKYQSQTMTERLT